MNRFLVFVVQAVVCIPTWFIVFSIVVGQNTGRGASISHMLDGPVSVMWGAVAAFFVSGVVGRVIEWMLKKKS